MIKIKEVVVVEGKYDKIKLKGLIDTLIIETNGFRIFKDKEKQNLLRKLANEKGILIMTDSDSAGFVIRNFLKGIIDNGKIKNCYIPEILGKEKRKTAPSKEGMIGVEGVENSIIIDAVKKSGATIINNKENNSKNNEEIIKDNKITKYDLYEIGLIGKKNSAKLRKELLKKLNLPTYMSTNAMLDTFNSMYNKEKVVDMVKDI